MTKQQFPEPTVGALIFNPEGKLFLTKSHKWRDQYIVVILLFLLSACSTDHHPHEKVYGTLWMQTSAEYQMIAEQSYLLAREKLDIGLEDSTWTAALEQQDEYSQLPPAVILDVDQTVLDNSPFQARLAKEDANFNIGMWEDWAFESRALAVPGAVEFAKYAQSKDVAVFYVTNRWHGLEEATRVNLRGLGFPVGFQPNVILCRGEKDNWGWDKSSRRRLIAEQYRILLLIGDDLNDFVTTRGTPNQRVELSKQYHEYWGEKWIVLPNPLDGSWERAIYNYNDALSNSKKLEMQDMRLETLE
jgi:5'-nucleotidase (lipoprotein e(P4) family)